MLFHVVKHQRSIFSFFLLILGPVVSGPVEAKLVDLLQAISSLVYKYPALNGEIIQPATAALINSVNGKSLNIVCCLGCGRKTTQNKPLLLHRALHRQRQVSVPNTADVLKQEISECNECLFI